MGRVPGTHKGSEQQVNSRPRGRLQLLWFLLIRTPYQQHLRAPSPTFATGKLIAVEADSGMTQLQRNPTLQDSLLDLFLTCNPSLVTEMETVPGISTSEKMILLLWMHDYRPIPSRSSPIKSLYRTRPTGPRSRKTRLSSQSILCTEAATWNSRTQWKHI